MNNKGDLMRYYFFLIVLLCGILVACSPAAEESTAGQATETEETSGEEHEEGNEDGEHDDEEAEHDEEGEEHREHGAHEHGAAVLTVAWSGNEIAMDLETPAFNILGFEHAPSTTAEQELLDESLELLQIGNLLLLSADAECTVTDAVVNSTIGEEEHDEEAEHEEEEGETHSDIDVSYNIHCQDPENIEELDVSELFAQFPNFEELRVQWVSDTQQSSKDLTPADPVLVLE